MRARMLITVGLVWLAAVLTVALAVFASLPAHRSVASGIVADGFRVGGGFRTAALLLVIAVVLLGWMVPLVAGVRARRRQRQSLESR